MVGYSLQAYAHGELHAVAGAVARQSLEFLDVVNCTRSS